MDKSIYEAGNAEGSNGTSNWDPNGYLPALSETQFRESLDSLLQTFENQPVSMYMDEDNTIAEPQSIARCIPNLASHQYSGFPIGQTISTGNRSGSESQSLAWAPPLCPQQNQQLAIGGLNLTSQLSSNLVYGSMATAPLMPFSFQLQGGLIPATTLSNQGGMVTSNPIPSIQAADLGALFIGNQTSAMKDISALQVNLINAMPSNQKHFVTNAISSTGVANNVTAIETTALSTNNSQKRKRPLPSPEDLEEQEVTVSEDDDDQVKRRQGRNVREQMRSQRITEQISDLRDLLKTSNIDFKPDKFSTLVTVDEYIRHLQQQSTDLDSELKNLLATISQTTEIVNNQFMPRQDNTSTPLLFNPDESLRERASPCGPVSCEQSTLLSVPESQDEDSMQFAKGIDYKVIFDCCPFACSITGIDGRFVDFNEEFLDKTGYTRDELILEECHEQPHAAEKVAAPWPADCDVSVASSSSCSKNQDSNEEASRPESPGVVVEESTKAIRNKSLFNILHKDDIERLFCSMSSMLQFREEVANNVLDEHETWSDTARLCRKDVKVCRTWVVASNAIIDSGTHIFLATLRCKFE